MVARLSSVPPAGLVDAAYAEAADLFRSNAEAGAELAELYETGDYAAVIRRVMQIADAAKRNGVADLRQSALKKVKDGLTSLEEINRVTVE